MDTRDQHQCIKLCFNLSALAVVVAVCDDALRSDGAVLRCDVAHMSLSISSKMADFRPSDTLRLTVYDSFDKTVILLLTCGYDGYGGEK